MPQPLALGLQSPRESAQSDRPDQERYVPRASQGSQIRRSPPLEATGSLRVDRKVFLERRQQERPEFALQRIRSSQGLVLEDVKEKTLGQILRVLLRIAAMSGESVQWKPVKLVKFS